MLFISKEMDSFIYRFRTLQREKRKITLPNMEKTTIITKDDIRFLFEDANPQPLTSDQSDEASYMVDFDNLPNIQSPLFDFTPTTSNEKSLMRFCKCQYKQTKLLFKMFGKMVKRVKKLEPEGYVSSNDNGETNANDQDEKGEVQSRMQHNVEPTRASHAGFPTTTPMEFDPPRNSLKALQQYSRRSKSRSGKPSSSSSFHSST